MVKLSLYKHPEFEGKTVSEIDSIVKRIYAKHRPLTMLAVFIQLFVMFASFRIYLSVCQADLFTGLSLAVASAVLGGWLSWLLLVNVAYPPLIKKEIHG